LESRDDSFKSREQVKRRQHLVVFCAGVADAAGVVQMRVFGSNRRIVEPRGNRMSRRDLTVVVLQDVGPRALQHAGASTVEPRGVLSEARADASGFDSYHLHLFIAEKLVEQTDRIAAASDAGYQQIGQASLLVEYLLPSLAPDHRLKVPHHRRVRMR